MTNNKMRTIEVRPLRIFFTVCLLIGSFFFLWQDKLFFFSAVGIDFMMLLLWLYADDEGEKLVKYKNKNKEQRRKILLDFLVSMQALLMLIGIINVIIMILFLILLIIKEGNLELLQ